MCEAEACEEKAGQLEHPMTCTRHSTLHSPTLSGQTPTRLRSLADFQWILLYLAIGTIFVKFSGRSPMDFWWTLDRLLLPVRVRVQVRFRVRFRWLGRYIYITVSWFLKFCPESVGLSNGKSAGKLGSFFFVQYVIPLLSAIFSKSLVWSPTRQCGGL